MASIWFQVGNALTISGAGNPAVATLDSRTIAAIDSDNEELRTYRFDGTDWSQLGNGLSITGAGTPALAAMSSTRVVCIDSALEELRAYDWDGANWSLVR